MIKNKALNIKIIFKTYLKILKKNISHSQIDVFFTKYQKNYF